MPEQTQEQNVDINQKYGTTSCLMPPNMLGNHSDAETERSSRKPFEIKMRYKRQTLQDMTRPLKTWLYKNRDNPYPTKAEKMSLAADSNMTLTQVSNWFANARRRLKNTVSNPDLSWGKRVKMYNSCVKGNQELLSISSEDSAWESGEDGETKPAQEMRSDSLHARLSASPHEPLGCYPGATMTTDPLSPSMLPLNLSRSATTLPPPPPHPLSTAPSQHPTTTERTPETAHKIVTEMLQQHLYQQQAQREETRRDSHDARVSQEEEMEQEEEQERLVEQRRCAPDCGNHDTLMISDVDQPPKFKNSILQRYLQDSYKHNITLGGMRGTQGHGNHHQHHSSTGSFMKNNNNGGGANNTSTNTPRHRNPSGSLSSHDYEDLSVSSRSTPTRDMLSAGSGGTGGVGVVPGTSAGAAWGISSGAGHGDTAGRVHGGAATAGDIHRMVGEEELWRQWPQIENKANEDMHWKEISAALALTALSRGDFSRNHNNL